MPGSKPPEALEAQIWSPGTGQDPAKYLVDPGHWDDSAKRMTPGDLAHARPWLDSGRRIFVFPTPTEGFRRTGQSMLGLHHYIGDQFVDAQVIHRDEARIEMVGVFPGLSAQEAMADLGNTLNDDPPEAGMILNVPGVFEQVKYVIPESWEFNHDTDDQTHSISYTITFVMIGEGRRIPDPSGTPPTSPEEIEFPGEPVDPGPPDPWQIRIGIGAGDQPGAPEYTDPAPPGAGPGTGGGSTCYVEFPVHASGYSDAQVADAACAYAASHGYGPDPENGNRMGMLMQDGVIEFHGSTPGVFIKYMTPSGRSTEWTPLPAQGDNVSTSKSFTAPTTQQTSVTTTDGARTFQDIADKTYGDARHWETVYDRNEKFTDAFGVARHEAADFIWPVGVKIAI